jgi:hypothetical protein
MKNLTDANRNLNIETLLRFKGFEKLNKYELSKVKGGDDTTPPVIFPH